MRNAGHVALWLWVAVAVTAPEAVWAVDVSGTLNLTVVDTINNCTDAGQATLTQTGTALSGSGSISLVTGTGCPPVLSGTMSGTVVGTTITVGFVTSQLGTASFTGTIAGDGNSMSGTWSAGPPCGFVASCGGTWSMTRTAGIPTLSQWGMIGMSTLLAGLGTWAMRRRGIGGTRALSP